MKKYRLEAGCGPSEGIAYLCYEDEETPATGESVYLASDVDARIAELEHQLDIRKAAIEAQHRLMERVKELEKALRFWIADETLVPAGLVKEWNEHIQLLNSDL